MSNIPGGPQPIIGAANSIAGIVGSLATSVLFEAPVTGLYMVGVTCHLVSTDNVGSIVGTLSAPHVASLTASPNVGTGNDTNGNVRTLWLNAGDQITYGTVASGTTANTVYDVFVTAIRVL